MKLDALVAVIRFDYWGERSARITADSITFFTPSVTVDMDNHIGRRMLQDDRFTPSSFGKQTYVSRSAGIGERRELGPYPTGSILDRI